MMRLSSGLGVRSFGGSGCSGFRVLVLPLALPAGHCKGSKSGSLVSAMGFELADGRYASVSGLGFSRSHGVTS